MRPKSDWRLLAEEAQRVTAERLARSLPADGYFGKLVRRLLPAEHPLAQPPAAPTHGGEDVVAARAWSAGAPAVRIPSGSGAQSARLASPEEPDSAGDYAAYRDTDGGTALALAIPPSARRTFRPGVSAPDFAVGEVVADRYEITRQLARTKKYTVYVAHHRQWEIDVVLKVPRDEVLAAPHALPEMEEGARRWITLGLHPHVAYCYQVDLIAGVPVLVIEYHAGGSLRPWITSARTANLRLGLNLAIQICHGLERAHACEVWHGSLGPENLLLTSDGTLRISDFGATRALPRETPGSAAGAGAEAFIAPEQWVDPAFVDAHTDVFALGVCLYEMLCGGHPYEVTRGPRREPRSGAEERALPGRLSAVLKRCVDWDHARRPAVAEVREELCAVHTEIFGKPSPFAVLPAATWDADGWNNQAVAMWVAGRTEAADAAWTNTLQLARDHLEATFNLGIVRWQRGDLSDAALVQALDQVATQRPHDWLAAYLRALVHLERGDAVAAVSFLEQAATRTPETMEVRDAVALERAQVSAGQMEVPKVAGHRAHQAFVSSVGISPDGRWVLSGGDDGNVCLWDAHAGRVVRTLEGHARRVSGVSLNKEATLAVSGSDDGTLRLWDLQHGRCRATLQTPGKVLGVAMSPNGRWAVSTSSTKEAALGADGTVIQRWNLATDRCLNELEGHGRAVRSVAVSGDGRRLLSGGDDHTVRLWDAAAGTQLLVFEGHTHFVSSVCLSADATRALSGSWDQTIRVWAISGQRCLRVLRGHLGIVTGVALSADGRTAVSGSLDGTVRVWDLDTGRCVRTFEGHTSMVASVGLSADGGTAVSGGWDDTVRVWALPRRGRSMCVPRLSARTTYAQLPSAEPQPDELLSAADRALRESRLPLALEYLRKVRESPAHNASPHVISLWRELTPRCRRTGLRGARLLVERAGPARTYAVHVAVDPDRIVSAGRDGRLHWWDAESARPLGTFSGHGFRVTALRATADQAVAVSGSADGTARVWDLRRGVCVQTLLGHQSVVTAVDLSAAAHRLLTASYDHTLRLWEMASGACVQILRGHRRQILTACLLPDGRRALSAGYEPAIKLWDAESGQCVWEFDGHTGAVIAVCASPDGQWLLSGSADHSLRLWSLESGDCVRRLAGHEAPVIAAAFTPDARWALSASRDGSVRLWALDSGECVHVIHREGSAVSASALSADGCRAVVAGADDRLSLYELEWDLEAPAP